MCKVFVLYKNTSHNFKTIRNLFPRKDIELVYVFEKKDLEYMSIEECKDKLADVLDSANMLEDYIVLNGPSYVAACAGYVWFTQAREVYNIIAYNIETKQYESKTNAPCTSN